MTTHLSIKQNVQQQWEKRAKRAHKKLARLEAWSAHERYELEITRRLLQKAADEDVRETWQIQVDVLEMMAGQTEDRIAEERVEIALCEAMLAEIRADMAAGE